MHHSRIIRIIGARPLGNNRWSRFNQAIPVPTNSEVNKVHSKFQNGTLTVIFPKEVITSPTKNVAQDQKPKTSITKDQDHKASQALSPQKHEVVASDDKQQKGQQLVEKQQKEIITTKVDQPEKEKEGQDQGLPPKAANLDAENYGKQKNDHKGVGDDHPLSSTRKVQEGNFPPTADKDSKQKDIGIISDRKQVLDHGKAKVNKFENEGKVSVLQDPNEASSSGLPKKEKHKESDTASIVVEKLGKKNMRESAEKGVENVAEKKVKDEDEERKLIVNMIAAVLVLVAFGAYVSFSLFDSFGKTKTQ